MVERHNALLWYPTQFEGFEYSPNIIYGGACANQHVVPLFEYLMAKGHETFLLLGSDYIFPRETNRIVRQLVEAGGGRILEERYIPLGGDDADVARALIGLPAADAIFSTIIGPCGLTRIRHAARAGHPFAHCKHRRLRARAQRRARHPRPATSAPRPISNRSERAPILRFLGAFHKRFGEKARANWFSVNSFMQVLLFAEAAEQAGSVEVDDIVQAIGIGEVEAPFGRCRIDPETNYTYCRSRIGVANERGRFRHCLRRGANSVRPDPFLVGYA